MLITVLRFGEPQQIKACCWESYMECIHVMGKFANLIEQNNPPSQAIEAECKQNKEFNFLGEYK